MNESMVSFQGWVGTEVTERYVGPVPVASFRVASTPRRWNKAANSWIDGETTWYTVNAWRSLALNCVASVEKGQPVVVYGKQTAEIWEDDAGNKVQTMVVEALYVGHDLNRGSTVFTRRQYGGDNDGDAANLKATNASFGVGGPQVSSDGETLSDMVDRAWQPEGDVAV